ncbi:hypothetical protein B0H19DRAFT_1075687 [Mycena capillaripes]|nr:hypothetical protein B0H19DRAFT_1075687 [Mycena capillaripes]
MLSRLATLTAIITSCMGQTNIGCFGDGAAGNCTSFIPTFCASLGIKTTVAGDFDAVNLGATTDTPSAGNCQTLLTQVSALTKHLQGGSGSFSGLPFTFFVDPNAGQCVAFPGGTKLHYTRTWQAIGCGTGLGSGCRLKFENVDDHCCAFSFNATYHRVNKWSGAA